MIIAKTCKVADKYHHLSHQALKELLCATGDVNQSPELNLPVMSCEQRRDCVRTAARAYIETITKLYIPCEGIFSLQQDGKALKNLQQTSTNVEHLTIILHSPNSPCNCFILSITVIENQPTKANEFCAIR